jgi:N-acetylneuraminic acid mutarotase
MFVYGGNLSYNNVIEKIQNELWCFNFASKTWTQSLDAHPARTEHSSVIFENNLYVFGGYGGNYMNDLLALPLPFTPESKFTTVPVTGDVPPLRSAHSLVVYKDHLYVYGGWRGIQATASNSDLYKFSFRERVWSQVHAKGEIPFRRRVHNAIVYKDSMYIFGGFDEGMNPSDFHEVHRFDFTTEEWSIIECRGDIPSGRSRSTAVQWGRFMYVFGGWDRENPNAEFYELDLETCIWREIDTNLRDLQVTGIQAHSAVVLGDWLVTFGGKSGGDKIYDQMFVCRLGRNRTFNKNISPPESGSESE